MNKRESITADILVFLLAGGQGSRLHPLTRDRAKPAVPFAGHYRIIDFTLSNCIHSGLKRVFVFTQYRSLSLERHVKRGYSFLPRELEEFIDTVPPQFRTSSQWYQGTADAVYQNVYLLERDRPKRTLILSGDHVYRLDYRDILRRHMESGAMMTMGVIEVPIEDATRMGVLEVDEEYRVIGFEEKPEHPKPLPSRKDFALASMGIYLFNTDTLVREVSLDMKRADSSHDFGKDILPRMVAGGANVFAFPFRDSSSESPGYWRDVGTLDAYFEAHSDVLGENPKIDLRAPEWPLFTFSPRIPATEIRSGGGMEPHVVDSVLAGGSVISGATIRGSFLGPDIRVAPGAVIEDSILMGKDVVGPGAHLKRVILDRDIRIPEGRLIGFDPDRDTRDFVRSPGGITVIARRMPLD